LPKKDKFGKQRKGEKGGGRVYNSGRNFFQGAIEKKRGGSHVSGKKKGGGGEG